MPANLHKTAAQRRFTPKFANSPPTVHGRVLRP
jgi:hypothetical protein